MRGAPPNLVQLPGDDQRVRFAADFAPCFCVSIDTEEDFDWSQPFRRDGYRLESLSALGDCQRFFADAGVVPAYLIDWPIADSPLAQELLCEAAASGACDIGVQLHPWVSPPFDEEVSRYNSYAGNLPPDLEREKIRRLRDLIVQNFAVQPAIYRAGRYGIGPATAQTLIDLGIGCDTSVRSGFTYNQQGGPDFMAMPITPWWVDAERKLLELPLTTLFSGIMRGALRPLFSPLSQEHSPLAALLARFGLLERIALTPEGIPVDKALQAIDIAIELNVPVLNFSFHSPSLAAGNTPYVQSAKDLAAFYRWWDAVLAHLSKRGIAARSMTDIMASARG